MQCFHVDLPLLEVKALSHGILCERETGHKGARVKKP